MNRFTEYRSERLGESFYYHRHATGVHIYVCPNPDSNSVYAAFAAKYGSLDDRFCIDGESEIISTPAGVAHFLEHKLFENEEGDAFERFAKTGASANASTSFDSTRYLFSAADNFEQSFEILLDFVQSPYFTEETVRKEQGIIGQEIGMYDDDPDWMVFFNLLKMLYHGHPVSVDIGGTVQSIAQITPEVLYKCYNAFYHPENMVIAVAGNVQPQTVLEIADRMLRPSQSKVARTVPNEAMPRIISNWTTRNMDTGVTQFQFGMRDEPESITARDFVLTTILLKAIAGPTTPLYERLLSQGLINATFSTEYMAVRGAQLSIFSGESEQPEKVRDEIVREIERIRAEGLDEEQFEYARRREYASMIRRMSDNDDIGNQLLGMFIDGINPYDMLEEAAAATVQAAQELLSRRLDPKQSALSIVCRRDTIC